MYLERNTKNRLYSIWIELRRRCRKPKQASYIDRQSTFYETWSDYLVFRSWALRTGYSDELSIDRIDNSLGYSPDNCKWSTRTEQQYNQHKKRIGNATSKYRGVSRYKGSNRFRSRIYILGRETILGYFDTQEEAALAYNKKLDELGINAPRNIVS